MITLINLIFQDPVRGLFVFLFTFSTYLWREQGKIKTEIKAVERMLENKKMDKDDFVNHVENHDKLHSAFSEKIDLLVEFVMGGKR